MIFDNDVVMCKCFEMLGEDVNADKFIDKSFKFIISMEKSEIFNRYIIELIKISYKLKTKAEPHEIKCTLYYALEMIHSTFCATGSVKYLKNNFSQKTNF